MQEIGQKSGRAEREPETGRVIAAGQSVEVGDFPLLQKQRRRNWRVIALLGAGTAAGLFASGLMTGAWITAGIAAVLSGTLHHLYGKELTAHYKREIVPQFVRRFCEAGRYEPNDGIRIHTFVSSRLFSSAPDRYRTEDLIEGCIGRTKFRFAEVHAQKEQKVHTKNGTRTTWTDIFRGFFFVADFNKHFSGQTTMVPHFPGAKWIAGRDRVLLENRELMKAFLVCSTDQTEARYILTPALMERIMGLWRRYPGKLKISFTGSCILVARACPTNHYEAGLWRSLRRCIERDLKAVRELTGLVEELNMNTRIWTKQ